MNNDFKDILSIFNGRNVDYLLVGAYALAVYGLPRATGDIDLLILTSHENAERAIDALGEFGAPMDQVAVSDLSEKGIVFQIGIAPNRIDIQTSIDGVEFADAWKERNVVEIEGISVPVISREHLIVNKRAAGRPQDLADVAWLENHPES